MLVMACYNDYRYMLFIFISQVINVFIVGTLKMQTKESFLNHLLYYISKIFPIDTFLCHCRTFSVPIKYTYVEKIGSFLS